MHVQVPRAKTWDLNPGLSDPQVCVLTTTPAASPGHGGDS